MADRYDERGWRPGERQDRPDERWREPERQGQEWQRNRPDSNRDVNWSGARERGSQSGWTGRTYDDQTGGRGAAGQSGYGEDARQWERERYGDRTRYDETISGRPWSGDERASGNPQEHWNRTMRQGGPERGDFRGRGPRGWNRSDTRIMEEVCQRLTEHPDIDASDIEVQVENGEVTLTGRVPGRRHKYLAEDTVEEVPGVRNVRNHVRVRSQDTQWRPGDDVAKRAA